MSDRKSIPQPGRTKTGYALTGNCAQAVVIARPFRKECKGPVLLRRAIVIDEGDREKAHVNVTRILDFFGVPWDAVKADELAGTAQSLDDVALIGPIDKLAAALKPARGRDSFDGWRVALFAFPGKDPVANEVALQLFCGDVAISLAKCAPGDRRICVSREFADIAGPMAGLEFTSRIGGGAYILSGTGQDSSNLKAIITVDGAPAFVRSSVGATQVFISASPEILNIDEPVGPDYFDIKEHFLAAVPLVMFVKSVFREVVWREQELGACLIVDDPLLKPRYGRCDFRVLRNSMGQHGFTTNISFIPWNWRRTSQRAARFFKETEPISVSIHGCDHTKSEFGDTSPASLQRKATLAISRMESHEARTGIHYDRVMIFPQGVFSSVCPEVLKRSGYTAAVNTETVPVDIDGESTRIRDVWDVAITRYGDFPIFTRRYAHHGLENFAFDLLLGKPCLIVSHHEFFKDDCHAVVDLIAKLSTLNCTLHWQSLGEVVRRACRVRGNEKDGLEVQMYGPDLFVLNPASDEVDVVIRKKECEADAIAEVRCNGEPTVYTLEAEFIVVRRRLEPRGNVRIKLGYCEHAATKKTARPLSFEVFVALRRVLSEIRDEYLA